MTPNGLSAMRTKALPPGNSITTLLLFIEFSVMSMFGAGKPYSKNPHTRTPIFGVQADWVLVYRVF